eukprot:105530-Pelagomonas_calceolata.AAC.3
MLQTTQLPHAAEAVPRTPPLCARAQAAFADVNPWGTVAGLIGWGQMVMGREGVARTLLLLLGLMLVGGTESMQHGVLLLLLLAVTMIKPSKGAASLLLRLGHTQFIDRCTGARMLQAQLSGSAPVLMPEYSPRLTAQIVP